MRFALLTISLALGGCSRYEYRLPETGATLEGAVTYGGESLTMAQIDVWGAKDQAIGFVDAGRYKVDRVPLGEVKIGINTEAMRGAAIGQQMAQKKGSGSAGPKFVSLPSKFWDPETSGVKTTIKRGKNTFDIVLTK